MSESASGTIRNTAADAKEATNELAGTVKRTLNGARESIAGSYNVAKDAVTDAQAAVIDKGTAAAKATGRYVQEYPWAAVGAAATIGVLIGMMLGRR